MTPATYALMFGALDGWLERQLAAKIDTEGNSTQTVIYLS
jgi:hypothetical protein